MYFIDIRPKKKYRNLNFQYKRKIIPEVQNVNNTILALTVTSTKGYKTETNLFASFNYN